MANNKTSYVGVNGIWKAIKQRYIAVANAWRKQLYHWVGKDGQWVIDFIDQAIDYNAIFYIKRLSIYDANPENYVEIHGKRLSDISFPHKLVNNNWQMVGGYWELILNNVDRLQNFSNGTIYGAAAINQYNGLIALILNQPGKYFELPKNDNDGINNQGLLGIDGNASFILSTWFCVSSVPAARRWLAYSGSAYDYLGIAIEPDRRIVFVACANSQIRQYYSTTRYTVNNWTKVTVVVDREGGGTSGLYINGVKESNPEGVQTNTAGSSFPVLFGARDSYDIINYLPPEINPLRTYYKYTLSNANTTVTLTSTNAAYGTARSGTFIKRQTGLYYFEIVATNITGVMFVGLSEPNYTPSEAVGLVSWAVASYGQKFDHQAGAGSDFPLVWTADDVIGILINTTLGQMTVYKNGILEGTPFASGINSDCEVIVALDEPGSITMRFLETTWTNKPDIANLQPVPSTPVYAPGTLETLNIGAICNVYAYKGTLDLYNIQILASKPLANVRISNTSGFTLQLPEYWKLGTTNDILKFTIPTDLPVGDYSVNVEALSKTSVKLPLSVTPVEQQTTQLIVNFSDFKLADEHFEALHSAWGGANGGVSIENISFRDGELILQAHGDLYTGNIQGVRKLDYKPKYHTDSGDPKIGQPWTTRVGACIVSRKYMGYGSYRLLCKIPPNLGVATAIWTFHYMEVYPADLRYGSLLADGLHESGNAAGGFYIVRNHEIDIEFPSHLTGGQVSNPSLSNMKCNIWRGEQKNWSEPATSPAYWEEYHDQLVPVGFSIADDNYHELRFDWHSDRVEYYIDSIKKHTNTNNPGPNNVSQLPTTPGILTFGMWFPSAPLTAKPWLADPAKAWAGGTIGADGGMKANFDTIEMNIRKFEFYPYSEPGEDPRGETYRGSFNRRRLELP